MKYRAVLCVWMGILILGGTLASVGRAQTGYPNKPIEYVVQASAGGASDAFVRNLALIFQTEKIISVPIVVNNKPGGSGAIAYGYTAQKAGNPYYLLNCTGNFISTPLEKPKVPGYKDFSPIALLAWDEGSIAVASDSAFKSVKDLVETARKRPKEVRFGGTSIGSQDHVTMHLLQRAGQCQFNYICYTGENEVIAALLGGHLDVGCFNPRMIRGHVEANKMRILAVSSAKRLASLPDVPTLSEMGLSVVWPMPRGVAAPKGIPAEAKNFLISAYKKLTQTQAWKKYVKDNALTEETLFGDDYIKYLESATDKARVIMKELGILK